MIFLAIRLGVPVKTILAFSGIFGDLGVAR